MALVRAIVCAGLYPNVVRARMPEARFAQTAQGAVEAANEEVDEEEARNGDAAVLSSLRASRQESAKENAALKRELSVVKSELEAMKDMLKAMLVRGQGLQ